MDVSIPLAALGGSNGWLTFKVTGTVQVSGSGFTPILDVMPDVGLPAGATTPP
jgi:hypothetical protein